LAWQTHQYLIAAFAALAALPDGQIDLAHSALLMAAGEYPGLDIRKEIGHLDALASAAKRRMGAERSPLADANALSRYLFDEVGFRGNREAYYDPHNSYLNDVLNSRLGLPITLSLVYIEVGKRLGLTFEGVGMPGHFLVRHQEEKGLCIDPFNGGVLLSEDECAQRLREATGRFDLVWNASYLSPIGNRDTLVRMLRNLKAAYLQLDDLPRMIRVIDYLLALSPSLAEERRDRGLLYYRRGDLASALADLAAYLRDAPDNQDAPAVASLVERMKREGR
jgi:regulator of sirC expression with transglutaminase-like and TPR domain